MSRPHFDYDESDPYITTRRAAHQFGVTIRTIQLWADQGRLPYVRTPGGHRRLRTSAVQALARERQATSTLPPLFASLELEGLVKKEVAAITDYLDHLADQPSAQPNKRFWLREISAMIRNGEHKRTV